MQAGFTMVELLIVLSVISILSAMALPPFLRAMKTAAVDQAAEAVAAIAEEARQLAIVQPLNQVGMVHGVLVQPAGPGTRAYVVRIRYNPDGAGYGTAEAQAGWMACTTGSGFFEEGTRRYLASEFQFDGLTQRLRWFYAQRTGYPLVYAVASTEDDAPVGATVTPATAPVTVTVAQVQAAGPAGTGGKRRTVTVIPTIGITHTDG